MDDLDVDLCFPDLHWWATTFLEKTIHYAAMDPGGIVSTAVTMDWVIDMDLEVMQ